MKCYREKEQSEKANLDDELQKLKKENKAFRVKVDGLTRKIEVIQESIKQKIKGSVLTLQAREEIEVKDPGLQGWTIYCTVHGNQVHYIPLR